MAQGPKGTIDDLNLIKRYINKLERLIQRNQVMGYKTLSADILTYYTSIDTLIQASTKANDLPAQPTLTLRIPPTDNPVV